MRAAGFYDENASAEGQQVIDTLSAAFKAAGIMLSVVDHHGKDPSAGPRGTSVKRDGVDYLIVVTGTPDDTPREGQVKFEKVRGAERGEVVKFYMDTVELGIDADGDKIDILAVRWGEPVIDERPAAKGAKERPQAHTDFLGALNEALRGALAVKLPNGLMGVPMGAVRWGFRRRYIPDDDAKDPAQARQKAFSRARDALRKSGEIAVTVSDDDQAPADESTLIYYPIG